MAINYPSLFTLGSPTKTANTSAQMNFNPPQVLGSTDTAATTKAPTTQPTNNANTGGANVGSVSTPVNTGAPSAPAAPDMTQQVNDLFNPQFDYLNNAESNLRSDYPNILQDVQNNFDLNANQLKTANQQAADQNAYSGNQADMRTEDSLAANRRLYSDLNRGYQQRFGGSTSAGQAASEIANVEQQRQQGLTTRQNSDIHTQLAQQRTQIDTAYTDNLAKLQQATASAKLQAQMDFNQKLLEIGKARADLGTSKAQANLQALQDLRNKVFSISQQNLQFQQNLALARQQAMAYNSNLTQTYATQASQMGQQLSQAYGSDAWSTNPTSNLQVQGGGNGQGSSNPYTGQINQQTSKPDFQRFPINGFTA